MFVPLEGRLTWERNDLGICVSIPGIHSLEMTLAGLSALFVSSSLLDGGLGPDSFTRYDLILTSFMGCVGLGSLIFAVFSGETILSANEHQVKIVRRCFGIDWRTRVFDMDSIGNLEYIDSRWRFYPIIRFIPSALSFRTGFESHQFAAGIREDEAQALIQKFDELRKPLEYVWENPSKER